MSTRFFELHGPEILKHVDEIMSVYEPVYSCPPYNESSEDFKRVRDGWETVVKKTGLKLVVASDEGRFVGMSFGWKSVEGGRFNTRFRSLYGDNALPWLEDCFELVDLAVIPEKRGCGLGAQLLDYIYEGLSYNTSLLQTHTTDTVASGMYARRGWEVLVPSFELPSGHSFRIFGQKISK